MLFEELFDLATKRRTAKKYDNTKNISEEDLSRLFEFINTAPTSMGLEAMKILNITRKTEKRDEILNNFKDYNIERAKNSSNILIFVTKNEDYFKVDNNELRVLAARQGEEIAKQLNQPFNEEMLEGTMQFLESGKMAGEKNSSDVTNWSEKQAYISLGYALLGAKALGIESTPAEGFEPTLEKYLKDNKYIDQNDSVAVVAFFGYTKGNDWKIGEKQIRLPIEKKFITL